MRQQGSAASAALFDGHVHMYGDTGVARLLSAAARNFSRQADQLGVRQWQGTLLLAEVCDVDWFGSLPMAPACLTDGEWQISRTAPGSIMAVARTSQCSLRIAAGRQINTAEKVELLALGCNARLCDGESLAASMAAAQRAQAMLVLPWGVGKWLGRRGELVRRTLLDSTIPVFAGDNSGRPQLWPVPAVLVLLSRAGRAVLSGTDNLPIPGEESRVGAFGFWMSGEVPQWRTGCELAARILQQGSDVRSFGSPDSLPHFVRTQAALRLHRAAAR